MAWGTPWAQRQGPPRIDLLPRTLVEQRLVRRQRGVVGAGFLVLLALLGLWYVLENRELTRAQDEADQERAVATGLRAERARLQPLADLEDQIAAAEQLRASVYRKEIRFSSVMRDISAIVPDDVWLTSMSAAFSVAGTASTAGAGTGTPAGGAATASTPGSPGAGSPVASITFAGAGLEHVDVGGFLRALARGPKKGGQQVYLNPYFTTSQKATEGGQETVTFSATVDLSTAAYSGRFQPAGRPAGDHHHQRRDRPEVARAGRGLGRHRLPQELRLRRAAAVRLAAVRPGHHRDALLGQPVGGDPEPVGAACLIR